MGIEIAILSQYETRNFALDLDDGVKAITRALVNRALLKQLLSFFHYISVVRQEKLCALVKLPFDFLNINPLAFLLFDFGARIGKTPKIGQNYHECVNFPLKEY